MSRGAPPYFAEGWPSRLVVQSSVRVAEEAAKADSHVGPVSPVVKRLGVYFVNMNVQGREPKPNPGCHRPAP